MHTADREKPELGEAQERLEPLVTELRSRNEALAAQLAERRQAEVSLRASEARFRAIFANAAIGIVATDLSGGLIEVNPALCTMLGYGAEELYGRSFVELTHPEDAAADRTLFAELVAGQRESYQIEKRYRRQDNSYLWVRLTVSLIRAPDGRPQLVIALVEDIAARKRAEEALRFLAEAGTVLVSALDYAATLQSVARLAVPAIADWVVVDLVEDTRHLQPIAVAHADPAKEALARELQRRYAPNPDLLEGYRRVLRENRSILIPEVPPDLLPALAQDEEQLRMIRELGPTSCMIVPLVARSRTLGALSLAITTSGRRYGADDLALAEELGPRVALAIDNARLYAEAQQAQAQVERHAAELDATIASQRHIQEQLRDLLRAVSHDLRNPLTAIQGQTELLIRALDRAGLAAGERRHAEAVLASARRMNAMIQDLVEAARVEAGQVTLRLEPVDLRGLIFDLLERQAATMEVSRVRVEGGEDLPPVLADSDRLERILINLLTNALKYGRPGTEVTITLRPLDGEVATAVTDRGPGIAPEDLPHVFERYFRGRVEGAVREGLGLGLFITRGLVQAHGGRIWVESQPGVGSTFTFTLPTA